MRERVSQKQTRAETGDSTIHLSLILCMIPSLCLSCSIPLSPLCVCLSSHSSCLCLAVLYLLSFHIPPPTPHPQSSFSFTACSAAFSLSAYPEFLIPKASLSPPFSSFLPQPPTFHPSKAADFLLLKRGPSRRPARCVRVLEVWYFRISANKQILQPWGWMDG